jgi:hypothetical protein
MWDEPAFAVTDPILDIADLVRRRVKRFVVIIWCSEKVLRRW